MKSEIQQKIAELEGFEDPRVTLEQYTTPPSLVADMIHTAYMQGDIDGKRVVDLGAGTGFLSIGAALAGGDVVAVEKDPEAVGILRDNAEKAGVDLEIFVGDISDFNEDVDTVVMNPPFSSHSEECLEFWKHAFSVGDAVYGLAPPQLRERIKDFAGNSNHEIRGEERFTLSLPPSFGFHTEEDHETEVYMIVSRR